MSDQQQNEHGEASRTDSLTRARILLVSTGGLGLLRPAPGTWGSLPTAGLAWLLLLLGAPAELYYALLIITLLVSSAICVQLGAWAESHYGRKDPSEVVMDETAGQCMPLLPLPFLMPELIGGGFWMVSIVTGAAFVLFRIMDIIKPWPARGLERLNAGWGVLVDDLFAGLYAAVVLGAALLLLPL